MSDRPPRIWILLGQRRGDNNQLLALGEALGLPFETRTLAYRRIARAIMRLFPRSIAHLDPASRRTLQPPWPDVVIGIGRRSVPVARWIQRQSGGASRIIRLGHPRAPNEWFDLVLTTPQYPVPDAENVVALPLALNRFPSPPPLSDQERRFFAGLPRPHFLLSLGGTAPMWRIERDELQGAFRTLLAQAEAERGTVIVATSPRTPDDVLEDLETMATSHERAVFLPATVRYASALANADVHAVTADSVSMISEAIATGRPVGVIPIVPNPIGKWRLGPDPSRNALRDPRRFWREVSERGLVGSVDAPRSGAVPDALGAAMQAIDQRFPALSKWSNGRDSRRKA